MGEREEMAARDAWQVGGLRSVVENHPDCVMAFLPAGKERHRSRQVQE